MKPPPFLVGAALLFWGWQTGFLAVGAVMAAALEGARFIKARWEFSDDDFSRVWTFCSLLFLATAVYAFTANEGPANFGSLVQSPTLATEHNAGTSSARTAAAIIRWIPMVFFLFVAAQAFSSREAIPLETISLILRRRWKKARKLGQPLPATRGANVLYPYFILCLVAASIHPGGDTTFFWGLCTLLTWALWSHRSRRFGLIVWACALAAAIVTGYFGQRGIGQLQRLLEAYNPQWLSAFRRQKSDRMQSKTALGHLGSLKQSGQIIIRLKPEAGRAPPDYLREASYFGYRDQVWSAGRSGENFENVNHEATNETTWVMLPGKTNSVTVNIACYLDGGEGLLPLPTGCGKLENLVTFLPLQKNNLGAVFAQGPGLVIFDAHYGPGATFDSAPGTNDFAVPSAEQPALAQIISEQQLSGLDTNRTLQAVSRFFQSQFRYSTWQGASRSMKTNETPLSRFLLRNRSGHCEYFATATVLLLRQLHIPARYAVGYAVHEASGRGYVVRQRDAHAWCLVWHDGIWQDFDTTPASWVEAEARQASPFQLLSDLWSWMGFEFSKFRWGQTRLRQYFLWALVPVLALLLYQILFRRKWRRETGKSRAHDPAVAWPGLDSEFYELERKLAQQGRAREPGEPLSNWLERATHDPAFTSLGGPLRQILRLHYRYRFDPLGLNPSDRETLKGAVRTCLEDLATARPTPRRSG